MALRQTMIRAGLETLYYSGAHRILARWMAGRGVILTLHHVRPADENPFQPNRLLEVTPAFLESTIAQVRALGFTFVSMDEVQRRLGDGEANGERFVALTFDDGYRDVAEYAAPLLRREGVPYIVYVASDFADGTGILWWKVLEEVVRRSDHLRFAVGRRLIDHPARDVTEKYAAFNEVYWAVRELAETADIHDILHALAFTVGVDPWSFGREVCMTWSELRDFAADPLVTIGAHTMTHPVLKKESPEAVRREIEGSMDAIERHLGVRPAHFAYPIGDQTSACHREFEIARACGLKTAVTTRPGVIFSGHRDRLMCLPRVSLNGEFQASRYVDVLLSGAPFALMNGLKRSDAA
jgi:peptidoglycan/xylan/chitin deacetylase (PgdA/CDA1 family)